MCSRRGANAEVRGAGARQQAQVADASAKQHRAKQYQMSAMFVRAELEREAEVFLTTAAGAKGLMESYKRMIGLNTLLMKLAQRHRTDDSFSVDLRPDQFSIPFAGALQGFRQVAQRSDGYPLYRGDFGDTVGRAIDSESLAARERQLFHELGLTIL